MTGNEFAHCIDALPISQNELARQWDVSSSVLTEEKKRGLVRTLYADAMYHKLRFYGLTLNEVRQEAGLSLS